MVTMVEHNGPSRAKGPTAHVALGCIRRFRPRAGLNHNHALFRLRNQEVIVVLFISSLPLDDEPVVLLS